MRLYEIIKNNLNENNRYNQISKQLSQFRILKNSLNIGFVDINCKIVEIEYRHILSEIHKHFPNGHPPEKNDNKLLNRWFDLSAKAEFYKNILKKHC